DSTMATSPYLVSSFPPSPPMLAATRPRAPRSRTISCSAAPIPLALLAAAAAAADAAPRGAPPTPVSPVCFTPSLLHAAPSVVSSSVATPAAAAAVAEAAPDVCFPANVGHMANPDERIRCRDYCCYCVQFLPLGATTTATIHTTGLLFGVADGTHSPASRDSLRPAPLQETCPLGDPDPAAAARPPKKLRTAGPATIDSVVLP
ncbi:hypothetical protein HK405_008248, partial [Cladochytrium tenue]